MNALSHVGLEPGTGMEIEYGDFGQFRDKLDESWHICGVHRDRAGAPRGRLSDRAFSLPRTVVPVRWAVRGESGLRV